MPHAGNELTNEIDKAFAAVNFLFENYGLLADEEEDEPMIAILAEKLIAEIEKTFADVEYPGDDNLAASKTRWDSVEFAEAVKGKHWKELSKDVLSGYAAELVWLTPEALRFYMPAFMIAELGPDGLGCNSYTFSFLQPLYPPESKHAERFRYKLSAFTADEKAVLRAFVKYGIEVGHIHREKETIKFWNL